MEKIAKRYLAIMEEEQQKQLNKLEGAALAFRKLQNGYAVRHTLYAPTDWSAIK